MKAVILDKPGKPSSLYMSDIALPEPGRGEVRVRVEAVSLNPVDYKMAAWVVSRCSWRPKWGHG